VPSTLYNFKGTPDGVYPGGALINVGGRLYGTTEIGGASDNGSVFSIRP
jgi:uncharacterized repeat protein (TIGR03803 family)